MIITLTTDFGVGSPYIAAMKGSVLAINPAAQIVDLTHDIAPQDVRGGANALAIAAPYFPAGTLHVAVVDPGVGTERAIVYAEIGDQRYLCPDNGLLSRLATVHSPSTRRAVTNGRLFRPEVSHTFHGRDIMGPVAAHLSRGVPPADLGPPLARLTALDWPGATKVAQRITGQIESIDSFGNLITNITRDMLDDAPRDASVGIYCEEHETRGIFNAYADQPPLTLIALFGSQDRLELAIVNDNAAQMLGVQTGATVEVRW